MGQGHSSQRQAHGLEASGLTQPTQRYEELGDDSSPRQAPEALLANNNDDEFRNISNRPSSITRIGSVNARHPEYHSTYRRETRARSTLISGHSGADEMETHGRDDVVLEQEERPLILRDMEVRLNDAPITDIQAAPMPRRSSMLSRIGSRVSRRNNNLRSRAVGRDTGDERLTGQSQAAETSTARPFPRPDVGVRRNRFSMFETPTGDLQTTRQNSRNRRSSFSNTFPPSEYPTDPEATDPQDSYSPLQPGPQRLQRELSHESPPSPSSQRGRTWRRSLVEPISHLLRNTRTRQQQQQQQLQRQRQERDLSSSRRQELAADETTTLISPQETGTDVSFTDSIARALPTRFGMAEEGTESNPAELDSPDRPTSWLSSRDSTDHPATDGRRSSRRMQQLLGGRSSRLIRREDDTPLSRVLQLAAAAIAAQLSGRTDSSPDLQSVGDDHFDGNLNAFIQSLNSAAEASANAEDDSNMTSLPPLNFWRVFRFVNSNARDGRSAASANQSTPSEAENSRLVTLVVVGVRSVPSSSLLNDTPATFNNNNNNNLDGILTLPPTPPDGLSIGSGLNMDGASTRNRLTRRRRTSFTSANPFPSQYDSQRHQSSNNGRLNRTTGLNPLRRGPSSYAPSAGPPRPPSPFPSGGRLGQQFARSDESPVLTSSPSTSSSRDTPSAEASSTAGSGNDSPSVSSIRQRPRSESHGHLGSGAARRNGVVEPDAATGSGRHWLIYVVGTNLSEDHPAFQAPSLFTDNPSYEDMLMLSALLGPVKPPVASAQDVATAHGVFRMEIRRADGLWLARAMDRPQGSHGVPSPLVEMAREVERCLVCLTDYESGDEIRQLQNCAHVFHRECIDTWLTTGRNSCPLCRGQGVDEKSGPSQEEPGVVQA